MQVSWDDIGQEEEPGTYIVHGIDVQIDYKQIKIWQEHPDAVFNTKTVPANLNSPARTLLTTWDIL